MSIFYCDRDPRNYAYLDMVLEWREAFAVMPVNGENALVENALEDAGIYLKSERKKKKKTGQKSSHPLGRYECTKNVCDKSPWLRCEYLSASSGGDSKRQRTPTRSNASLSIAENQIFKLAVSRTSQSESYHASRQNRTLRDAKVSESFSSVEESLLLELRWRPVPSQS